jgi:FKBP12-rapamycin complex-associated protein
MTLQGSDGIPYTFLLKGHEDIRQDERVMQLFGLVNTLLNNDSELQASSQHPAISSNPAIAEFRTVGLGAEQ